MECVELAGGGGVGVTTIAGGGGGGADIIAGGGAWCEGGGAWCEGGPWCEGPRRGISNNRKIILPDNSLRGVSVKALIH